VSRISPGDGEEPTSRAELTVELTPVDEARSLGRPADVEQPTISAEPVIVLEPVADLEQPTSLAKLIIRTAPPRPWNEL